MMIRKRLLTKKFNLCFCRTKLVSSFTCVHSKLLFFNSNNTKSGVCVLISSCEMRNTIMLIVRQLNLILVPANGRWWVSFYVAFQIHVILQSLTKAWPGRSNYRRKLNFKINISPGSSTDSILSHAIVRSTIFFTYRRDFQCVSTKIQFNYNFVLKISILSQSFIHTDKLSHQLARWHCFLYAMKLWD